MTTPKQRAARVTRTVRDFRTGIIDREKTAIGSLVQAYDAAYQSLIDELTAATENAQRAIDRGDPVVNTWRVNRAVELTRQAEQLLQEIAQQGGGAIAEQRRGAARDAFKAAGQLLDAVMGEPPASFPNASSFMQFPAGAMEQLTGTLTGGPLQELLDDAAEQGAVKAGKILTGAIVTGTHPDLIAGALREALDTSMYRASLIARTEINRTYREALRETMVENRHITPKWRWRSARSLTTCSACWAMDGKLFDVEEPMGTHPGCFPAGMMATAAGVRTSFQRWFDGDLIDISLASGQLLSVTPNHPILTPDGWVAAGALHEGGDVIRSCDPERMTAAINPDDHHGPALIEKIAVTIGGAAAMPAVTVPTTTEDFHGDGIDGEVCVVRTNGTLNLRRESAVGEPALHELFVGGHERPAALSALRTAAQFLETDFATPDSFVSSGRELSALLGRGLSHAERHAFAATAWRDALGDEPCPDCGSTAAERRCQRLLGLAGEIPADEFVNRDIEAVGAVRPVLLECDLLRFGGSPPESAPNQLAFQEGLADRELARSLLTTHAGDIGRDRILNVVRRKWSGHVYNLETKDGWYIVNGIIVHNCRCSIEPEPISWEDLAAKHGLMMPPGDHAIPREPTGPEAFAELPAEQQQRILDPGRKDGQTPRWDAFNAGQVELRDFVHTSHSDDWGTTRRESGLSAALERSKKRNGGVLPGRPIEPKPPKPMPEQLADRHGDLVTMAIQSPEDRKASLSVLDWELPEHRKIIPKDLQQAIGAKSDVVRVDSHAWNVVQPPPPGVKVNRSGDALVGEIGKHHSAQPLFNDFDRVIEKWKLQGLSSKSPENEDRWEVYTPVDSKKWYLTIIGVEKGTDHHRIVSSYLINNTSVQNRLNQANPYLIDRGNSGGK